MTISDGNGADQSVEARIERLEAIEAIRQLCARYALAIDTRSLDHLMSCFPPDVQVGRDQHGREALKQWFDATLRDRFTQTAHIIANHLIEFDDGDQAHGVLYCRAEHEMRNDFVVVQMQYWDSYERLDGQWFFRRRLPLFWYAAGQSDVPVGPDKVRWPDRPPEVGTLPEFWPSWDDFWSREPSDDWSIGALPPEGQFLRSLRVPGR